MCSQGIGRELIQNHMESPDAPLPPSTTICERNEQKEKSMSVVYSRTSNKLWTRAPCRREEARTCAVARVCPTGEPEAPSLGGVSRAA